MGLFADGAAVRTTGAETFRVARDYVDSMMTVTTDEICQVNVEMGHLLDNSAWVLGPPPPPQQGGLPSRFPIL